MPGPAPKPAERRQRRNQRWGPALVRDAQDAEATPVPEAPRGFLKVTRELWESYWSSPLAEVVDRGTDLPAIRRLFSLIDERERAYRAYKDNRLVPGSKGQPVINPLARQISAMDPEIRQLEDRFGLTPKSRAVLGIRLGESKKSLEQLNASLVVDEDPA